MELVKACSKCSKVKPLEEFYKSVPSSCKECIKATQADYHKANPEKKKAHQAAYRIKHREEIKAANKIYSNKYYAEHRERDAVKNRQRSLKHYYENKELVNAERRGKLSLLSVADKEARRFRFRLFNKKYYVKHHDKILQRLAGAKKIQSDNLSNSYVVQQLIQRTPMKVRDIPLPLIQAKRAHLQLARKIKELKT